VASFRGCEARWARIFGGELIASVLAIPNLIFDKSFLLGDVYPMVESSWCLGMYS
jgi:hypothetical protein